MQRKLDLLKGSLLKNLRPDDILLETVLSQSSKVVARVVRCKSYPENASQVDLRGELPDRRTGFFVGHDALQRWAYVPTEFGCEGELRQESVNVVNSQRLRSIYQKHEIDGWVREGTKFALVVMYSNQIEPVDATWNNLIRMVNQAYEQPESRSELIPSDCCTALSELSGFDRRQHPPEKMTYPKFCSLPEVTPLDARLFLWDSERVTYFDGTGKINGLGEYIAQIGSIRTAEDFEAKVVIPLHIEY